MNKQCRGVCQSSYRFRRDRTGLVLALSRLDVEALDLPGELENPVVASVNERRDD